MSLLIGMAMPLSISFGIYFLIRKGTVKKSKILIYLMGKIVFYSLLIYFTRNVILESFTGFLIGLGAGTLLMFSSLVWVVYKSQKGESSNGNG